MLHYSGSKIIFLVELNLYRTKAIIPPTSNAECLKDRFQVHYCFCYTFMTCVMCKRPWISFFFPMIPTYFFPIQKPKSTDGNCEY